VRALLYILALYIKPFHCCPVPKASAPLVANLKYVDVPVYVGAYDVLKLESIYQ
jgi:hypothetical protein